jgi:hypothetical protein
MPIGLNPEDALFTLKFNAPPDNRVVQPSSALPYNDVVVVDPDMIL